MYEFYSPEFLSKFGVREENSPERVENGTYFYYEEDGLPRQILLPEGTSFYNIYFSVLKHLSFERNGKIFLSVFSFRVGKRIVKFCDISEMELKSGKKLYYPTFNNGFIKLLYFGKKKKLSEELEQWIPIYRREDSKKETFLPRTISAEGKLKKTIPSPLQKEIEQVYDPELFRQIDISRYPDAVVDHTLLKHVNSPYRIPESDDSWLQHHEIFHYLKSKACFPFIGNFETFHSSRSSADCLERFVSSFYPHLKYKEKVQDFSIAETTREKYHLLCLGDGTSLRKAMIFYSIMARDNLLPGGILIMKFPEILSDFSRDILYFLSCFFEESRIIRPETTDRIKSEVYFLGIHFIPEKCKGEFLNLSLTESELENSRFFDYLPGYFLDPLFLMQQNIVKEQVPAIQKRKRDYQRDRSLSFTDIIRSNEIRLEKFAKYWLEKYPYQKERGYTRGW